MPKQKNKTLDQLQKDRLRAEINKLNREREEIERRLNQKWYFSDLGLKIIGLIVTIVIVGAAFMSIIIPLTQTRNQLAKDKIELAQTKLDSALNTQARTEVREKKLNKKVKAITTRLDSIKQNQKTELDSIVNQFEKERAKSQIDQKRIKVLESRIASLNSQIRRTELEKEQIEKILPIQSDLYILSGRVITRENNSKFPLNGVEVKTQDGSFKDTTDEHGYFKLEIPKSRGIFVKMSFSKPGYSESTQTLQLPNKNIEIILKRDQ